MAWVRLRDGRRRRSTAEAVRAFCRGRLAHYKIPRYVHVVDEFPMTVTGKVRKVEMRRDVGRAARPGDGGGDPERLDPATPRGHRLRLRGRVYAD